MFRKDTLLILEALKKIRGVVKEQDENMLDYDPMMDNSEEDIDISYEDDSEEDILNDDNDIEEEEEENSDEMDIIESLQVLLSSEYVLAIKTHSFHWNVIGSTFSSFHDMWGSQYQKILGITDEIAERIRQLNEIPISNMSEFLDLSEISEVQGSLETGEEQSSQLISDHETLSDLCDELIEQAEEESDDATMDLAIQTKKYHEKILWMLKSIVPVGPDDSDIDEM